MFSNKRLLKEPSASREERKTTFALAFFAAKRHPDSFAWRSIHSPQKAGTCPTATAAAATAAAAGGGLTGPASAAPPPRGDASPVAGSRCGACAGPWPGVDIADTSIEHDSIGVGSDPSLTLPLALTLTRGDPAPTGRGGAPKGAGGNGGSAGSAAAAAFAAAPAASIVGVGSLAVGAAVAAVVAVAGGSVCGNPSAAPPCGDVF